MYNKKKVQNTNKQKIDIIFKQNGGGQILMKFNINKEIKKKIVKIYIRTKFLRMLKYYLYIYVYKQLLQWKTRQTPKKKYVYDVRKISNKNETIGECRWINNIFFFFWQKFNCEIDFFSVGIVSVCF